MVFGQVSLDIRRNVGKGRVQALGRDNPSDHGGTGFNRHRHTVTVSKFDMHMRNAMLHSVNLDAPVVGRWIIRHGVYSGVTVTLFQAPESVAKD